MLKTLKRKIALVAVAALGAGGLSIVAAPVAFAAASDVRLDGTPGLIIRTDAAADLSVTLESSAAIADQTDITVTLERNDVALAAVPAGLTIAWTTNAAERDGTAGADAQATANDLTVDADDAVGAANVALATITFARTMAVGKYEIIVTEAGSDAVTFTTYVSTAPTAMAWDATSYTMDATDTKNAVLALTDAGSRPTYLLPGEAIDLAITGGATGATRPTSALSFLDANTAGNTATSVTIGLTTNTATAGAYTIAASRASGLTGLAAASSTINVGAAPVASSAIALKTTTFTNSNTANLVADNNTADAAYDGTATAANSDSKNTTNDVYDLVFVSTASPALTFVGDSDTNDLTTGNLRFIVSAHGGGNAYPNGVTAVAAADVAVTDATGANNKSTAEYTVTSVSPVQGSGYRIAVRDGANVQGLQVEYQNPVPNSITRTTPTSTPILTVKGGKSTATATVRDQFGVALANVFVGASITGRNAQSKNLVSDANGLVTMEWTDTYVESTTNTATADVLTFTIVGQQPTGAPAVTNTATLTINYAASVEVGTVTGSGLFEETAAAADGNTVYEGTVATTGTATALTIAPNVATGNNDFQDQIQVRALVRDATLAAAAMQGVPVVFTGSDGVFFAAQTNAPNASKVPVAGSTAVRTITVFTSNLGEAFAQARFTKAGTATITMTSGGKTATLSVTVATDDAFAHTIAITNATSAADAPATLTATVTDPFGNAVSAADVSFVATGGVFLNGLNAVSGTTDSNGQVVVQVASGDKTKASSVSVRATVTENPSLVGTLATDALVTTTTLAIGVGVSSATATVTFTAPTAGAASTAIDAVKSDVKAVSDTVATLSKAVTTIQSSVTELTSSFSAQIKSLSSAIAKISRAIAALSKRIK